VQPIKISLHPVPNDGIEVEASQKKHHVLFDGRCVQELSSRTAISFFIGTGGKNLVATAAEIQQLVPAAKGSSLWIGEEDSNISFYTPNDMSFIDLTGVAEVIYDRINQIYRAPRVQQELDRAAAGA
jgi:hypothetical protein